MNDKDTKEIPIVNETTPNPTEGDEMLVTLESLDMRVKVIEAEIAALKAGLLTPQQIADMIATAINASVKRVETLVENVSKYVADNMRDTEGIDKKLAERATNAAESDRLLHAVIGWINIMAARDVTDPESKAIAEPYFDAVKRLATEANALSLATAREINESRTDHALSMQTINTSVETVKAIAEDLKPLALSVARAQTLIDFGLNLAKRPRLAFGLFVSGLVAFGGGAVVTPEVLKAIGNLIVSFVSQGAN